MEVEQRHSYLSPVGIGMYQSSHDFFLILSEVFWRYLFQATKNN